ncbi:hypothetical protein [Treponema sp. UBA7567]|nr:hypothetical protein [Treponema sp. UBA7567]
MFLYHGSNVEINDISRKGFFFYRGTSLACRVQLRTLPETL